MTADVDEWIGPSRAVPAVGVAGLVGLVICIATGAYVVAIGAVVVTTFLMATTSPELGSPDETAEFSPEAIATNRAISARIETVGDWIPIQLTDDSNWDAGVVKLGGVLQGSLLSLSVRQSSTEVGTRKRPIAIAVISKSTNGFLYTSNGLPAFSQSRYTPRLRHKGVFVGSNRLASRVGGPPRAHPHFAAQPHVGRQTHRSRSAPVRRAMAHLRLKN